MENGRGVSATGTHCDLLPTVPTCREIGLVLLISEGTAGVCGTCVQVCGCTAAGRGPGSCPFPLEDLGRLYCRCVQTGRDSGSQEGTLQPPRVTVRTRKSRTCIQSCSATCHTGLSGQVLEPAEAPFLTPQRGRHLLPAG